jgi:hypothetical protein
VASWKFAGGAGPVALVVMVVFPASVTFAKVIVAGGIWTVTGTGGFPLTGVLVPPGRNRATAKENAPFGSPAHPATTILPSP